MMIHRDDRQKQANPTQQQRISAIEKGGGGGGGRWTYHTDHWRKDMLPSILELHV
jgi:hypothetical protein